MDNTSESLRTGQAHIDVAGAPAPAVATLDIGVDLDGVVYDFVAALRHYVASTTGRSHETLPAASCWEFYDVDWGMTLDEFLGHFEAGVNDGVIFSWGTPVPGAREGMRSLLDAGHRIHIVTDRANTGAPGVAEAATRAWLAEHRLPFTTLTFSADKTAVRTDAFIEDRPKNYDSLDAAGVHAFLYHRLYNAAHPGRRVSDWQQFVAEVGILAARRAAGRAA